MNKWLDKYYDELIRLEVIANTVPETVLKNARQLRSDVHGYVNAMYSLLCRVSPYCSEEYKRQLVKSAERFDNLEYLVVAFIDSVSEQMR